MEVKLCKRVGDAGAGRWRRPRVPIARWDGTDSEQGVRKLLSGETESIRTERGDAEGKLRT